MVTQYAGRRDISPLVRLILCFSLICPISLLLIILFLWLYKRSLYPTIMLVYVNEDYFYILVLYPVP